MLCVEKSTEYPLGKLGAYLAHLFRSTSLFWRQVDDGARYGIILRLKKERGFRIKNLGLPVQGLGGSDFLVEGHQWCGADF